MVNDDTILELKKQFDENIKTVILTSVALVAPILFWGEPRTILFKFIYRSYIWLVGDGQSLVTISLLGYAWADRKIITPSRRGLKIIAGLFISTMLINYQIVGLDGGVFGRFIYDTIKYEPKLTGLVFILGSLYNLTLLIFMGKRIKIPKQVITKIPKLPALKEVLTVPAKSDSAGDKLQQVLNGFNVSATVSKELEANAFIRYNINLSAGVKYQQVEKLQPEFRYALEQDGVNCSMLGGRVFVDVAKLNRDILYFKDIASTPEFKDSHPLSIPMGVDVLGKVIYINIQDLPHLLVAGTTGSGKSVFLNVLICSLLLKSEVELILIDPKFVEFSMYEGSKLLKCPIINSVEESVSTLTKLVNEMNDRYKEMAKVGAKKIDDFNAKSPVLKMKYIIVIIDELADLVSTAREEINTQISLLVGKARACGIFLIVATQKPSISDKVITGVIKGNLPSKVAFSVGTSSDSQMILDEVGAERLLGKGDMLLKAIGQGTRRLQCLYISDDEIADIVGEPVKMFSEATEEDLPKIERRDVLTEAVTEKALELGEISTSKIQTLFGVGYNRASKIMLELEDLLLLGSPRVGAGRTVEGRRSS